MSRKRKGEEMSEREQNSSRILTEQSSFFIILTGLFGLATSALAANVHWLPSDIANNLSISPEISSGIALASLLTTAIGVVAFTINQNSSIAASSNEDNNANSDLEIPSPTVTTTSTPSQSSSLATSSMPQTNTSNNTAIPPGRRPDF